jgi:hypothetical protein
MALDRHNLRLIPIELMPPERSYGYRRWREAVGFTRLVAEAVLIDSVYLASYLGQALYPPLASSAKAAGQTLTNPTLHKWLLIWSGFLFLTCY